MKLSNLLFTIIVSTLNASETTLHEYVSETVAPIKWNDDGIMLTLSSLQNTPLHFNCALLPQRLNNYNNKDYGELCEAVLQAGGVTHVSINRYPKRAFEILVSCSHLAFYENGVLEFYLHPSFRFDLISRKIHSIQSEREISVKCHAESITDIIKKVNIIIDNQKQGVKCFPGIGARYLGLDRELLSNGKIRWSIDKNFYTYVSNRLDNIQSE